MKSFISYICQFPQNSLSLVLHVACIQDVPKIITFKLIFEFELRMGVFRGIK